jgi:hypothetical protein
MAWNGVEAKVFLGVGSAGMSGQCGDGEPSTDRRERFPAPARRASFHFRGDGLD